MHCETYASVTAKRLIKKASPALRRDSRSRGEIVLEFSSCARIRLHDCSINAGDNAQE